MSRHAAGSRANLSSAMQSDLDELLNWAGRKRDELAQQWPALASGAIHGDFAPDNLVVNDEDEVVGIFDLNLAGDAPFLDELAHVAIHLADEQKGGNGAATIGQFLQSYTAFRGLTRLEELLLMNVVRLIRPFRWRRPRDILVSLRSGDASGFSKWLAWARETAELSRGERSD